MILILQKKKKDKVSRNPNKWVKCVDFAKNTVKYIKVKVNG